MAMDTHKQTDSNSIWESAALDDNSHTEFDIKEEDDSKSTTSQTALQKRRFADVKPPYSYIALITMALESSTSGIYGFCKIYNKHEM